MATGKALKQVVVTGATGKQGGSVVRFLLKDGGYKLRAITRDPTSASAKALAAQGVEVVKANMNKKDELAKAFEGAWGVFGVTNFWDPAVIADPDLELKQGNNIVDAAKEAKVQVLVYSTLSDVKTATEGKIHVPHFTNKWLSYQHALKSGIPSVVGFMAGCYSQNLANSVKPGKDGVIEFGMGHLRADVALPWFDVDDTGLYVSAAFGNPEKWKGKIIRSGVPRTMVEVAELFTKVTGKPARFSPLPRDIFKNFVNAEFVQMVDQFNSVGYYLGTDISDTRKEFPAATPIEGWFWKSGFEGGAPAAKHA